MKGKLAALILAFIAFGISDKGSPQAHAISEQELKNALMDDTMRNNLFKLSKIFDTVRKLTTSQKVSIIDLGKDHALNKALCLFIKKTAPVSCIFSGVNKLSQSICEDNSKCDPNVVMEEGILHKAFTATQIKTIGLKLSSVWDDLEQFQGNKESAEASANSFGLGPDDLLDKNLEDDTDFQTVFPGSPDSTFLAKPSKETIENEEKKIKTNYDTYINKMKEAKLDAIKQQKQFKYKVGEISEDEKKQQEEIFKNYFYPKAAKALIESGLSLKNPEWFQNVGVDRPDLKDLPAFYYSNMLRFLNTDDYRYKYMLNKYDEAINNMIEGANKNQHRKMHTNFREQLQEQEQQQLQQQQPQQQQQQQFAFMKDAQSKPQQQFAFMKDAQSKPQQQFQQQIVDMQKLQQQNLQQQNQLTSLKGNNFDDLFKSTTGIKSASEQTVTTVLQNILGASYDKAYDNLDKLQTLQELFSRFFKVDNIAQGFDLAMHPSVQQDIGTLYKINPNNAKQLNSVLKAIFHLYEEMIGRNQSGVTQVPYEFQDWANKVKNAIKGLSQPQQMQMQMQMQMQPQFTFMQNMQQQQQQQMSDMHKQAFQNCLIELNKFMPEIKGMEQKRISQDPSLSRLDNILRTIERYMHIVNDDTGKNYRKEGLKILGINQTQQIDQYIRFTRNVDQPYGVFSENLSECQNVLTKAKRDWGTLASLGNDEYVMYEVQDLTDGEGKGKKIITMTDKVKKDKVNAFLNMGINYLFSLCTGKNFNQQFQDRSNPIANWDTVSSTLYQCLAQSKK